MRYRKHGSSDVKDRRDHRTAHTEECVRWPDPSPLSSWWERVVWGDRSVT
ncbi:hypothetical protein GFS60_05626 [Rhodococcus sp. WAY2]|nr:hypothetical protein GFS60_05626 [Rhodococcus sp. WAY2]